MARARDDSSEQAARLPRWKLFAFSLLVTSVFLVLLEALLWAAGVKPAYYRADPLVGFASQIPHFGREDGEVVVLPSKADEMNPQRFPAAKAEGVTRIFCLGGSTTYGHPFFDRTSFCGYLRAFLEAAEPSRAWEVVNAGAISYASYRIAGVMRELAAYEPDLFVLYTGQNEFLERRTYEAILASSRLTFARALLERTRTVGALRQLLDLARPEPAPSGEGLGLEEEVQVARFDAVGPEAFTRESTPRGLVADAFASALEGMVDLAEQVGAGIVFVVPASNLADFAPFKSEPGHDLPPGAGARLEALLAEGRRALERGAPEQALRAFEIARAIDDRHAALSYWEGRALLAAGRPDAARAAFERALEEDVVPFRAPAAIRDAMRAVAAARDVPLVDFERLVETRAPNGIAGQEHFVDHVHPTVETNRALALAILARMAEEGLVRPEPGWSEAAADAVARRVWEGIDRPAYAARLRKLSTLLDRVGQPEQARKQSRAAIELSGGDPESWYQAGVLFYTHGRTDEAVTFLREAAAGLPESPWPRAQLGVALAAEGHEDEARAELEAALAIDGDVALAHEHLGLLDAAGGRFEAAAAHFEEALRVEPSPATRMNLGILYTRLRRDREAIPLLREGLAASPGETRARFHYGMALERTDRRAEAAEQYRQVLRIAPEHPQARRRLRRLERN